MTKKINNFTKVEAAGNDFILFENAPISHVHSSENIQAWCDRHRGIGADGVIFLWQESSNWNWRFFNADGSETDLCGNAARCVGRFLQLRDPEQNEWAWRGNLGLFRARQGNPAPGVAGSADRIAVNWPIAEAESKTVPDELISWTGGFNDHGLASLQWWQVGVPHIVLLNHEVWNAEQRLGVNPGVRSFQQLGPEGANVTWVSLKTMATVTFERGVETETLACGSGALAAFLSLKKFANENQHAEIPIRATFKFPGGDLEVIEESTGVFWLVGPARIVFHGQLA